jgi:hypothetical protein
MTYSFCHDKKRRQKEKDLPPAFTPFHAQRGSHLLAAAAILVERPIADGFVDDDIAVTDFDVIAAHGVRANPGLVLDRSSLATEIRKRNQITFITTATPGKRVLHEIASFLLKRG